MGYFVKTFDLKFPTYLKSGGFTHMKQRRSKWISQDVLLCKKNEEIKYFIKTNFSFKYKTDGYYLTNTGISPNFIVNIH